ncbi:MAG: hypothetical protein ACMG51_07640 [Ginsengibacter sp.]
MRNMAGSYGRSLKTTFVPEFHSMNILMAGMVPGAALFARYFDAARDPLHPVIRMTMGMRRNTGSRATERLAMGSGAAGCMGWAFGGRRLTLEFPDVLAMPDALNSGRVFLPAAVTFCRPRSVELFGRPPFGQLRPLDLTPRTAARDCGCSDSGPE